MDVYYLIPVYMYPHTDCKTTKLMKRLLILTDQHEQ